LVCDVHLRCTNQSEYRNCRDCVRECPDEVTCGAWYSEWRDQPYYCHDYNGCLDP
jgi:hypothetical protein